MLPIGAKQIRSCTKSDKVAGYYILFELAILAGRSPCSRIVGRLTLCKINDGVDTDMEPGVASLIMLLRRWISDDICQSPWPDDQVPSVVEGNKAIERVHCISFYLLSMESIMRVVALTSISRHATLPG